MAGIRLGDLLPGRASIGVGGPFSQLSISSLSILCDWPTHTVAFNPDEKRACISRALSVESPLVSATTRSRRRGQVAKGRSDTLVAFIPADMIASRDCRARSGGANRDRSHRGSTGVVLQSSHHDRNLGGVAPPRGRRRPRCGWTCTSNDLMLLERCDR